MSSDYTPPARPYIFDLIRLTPCTMVYELLMLWQHKNSVCYTSSVSKKRWRGRGAQNLPIAEQPEALILPTLRQNIVRIVWPATTESVLQMLVGIVATAMVGHLGAEAIGAVGLSTRVTQIVWALFSAVGTGATVLIARAVGANDREAVERTAVQALVLAIAVVSVLTALVVWQARGIMSGLFPAPSGVLDLGFMYLSIVALGMPFMAIMQVAGAIMRGAGNTRTPMAIAFVVNGINVGLTSILIYGHFGLPAFGLRGAAVAVVVAQAVGAVLAFLTLTRVHNIISGSAARRYRPQVLTVRRILAIGVPAAFEMIFWQAANIVLMRLIIRFGTAELAAHQLGLTAESLSFMPAVGFGIAATALMGQSLGAKNPRLAERYVAETVRLCALLTVFTAGILFFLPEAIMDVLTNDAEVIRLGAIYLRLMALAQLPQQIAGVLNGGLRGAGDTKAPMVIGGVGLWLVRLPLAWALGVGLGLGIRGVWIAMTIDLFLRFGASTYRYYRGPWKRVLATGNED